MQKPIAFVSMFVCLTLVACGKKDNPVVVDPNAVTVATVPPYIPPANPGLSLQQYCSSIGGQMTSATICSQTLQFNGGSGYWTFNVNIGGPYATIPTQYGVYSGQRVSVTASSGAKIYVGNNYMGTGSISFVSNMSGPLQYYLTSLAVNAGVQSVQLTTCLSGPAQATTCP